MMANLKNRMKKLEKGQIKEYSEILSLIRKGAFYDELTPEQQAQYKRYKQSLGNIAEDIEMAEAEYYLADLFERSERTGESAFKKEGVFHFRLSKRKAPPTKEEIEEEFKKNQKEVEEYMKQAIEEYNSPEAKAKREEEYKRMTEENRKNMERKMNE